MSFFSHLDSLSDITDITFYDRKRLGPLDAASHHIMRGESEFSEAEREMMAAYVSGLNACAFCFGSHQAVAQQFGVDESLFQALLHDVDSADIAPSLKPVFKYLKKLTQHAAQLTQRDFDAILEVGYTEKAIQDVILVGSLFNFYNRLLDGHGIKGNEAIYQFGSTHLHKNGYRVPWFISYVRKGFMKQKRKKLLKMMKEG